MGGDDELGVLSQVCCLPARLPAWAAVPCPAACALSLLVAPLLPLLFAHFSSVCVQYYHLPFVSDRSLLWDAVYAKGSPNYTAEAPWPYFHHDRWAPWRQRGASLVPPLRPPRRFVLDPGLAGCARQHARCCRPPYLMA